MKLDYLTKIIHRIQHDIHCPKCKKSFARNNIEILSVNRDHQVEFSSGCDHCGARCHVSAVIEKGQRTKVIEPPKGTGRLISSPTLDPADIKETLQNFKGQDIFQLFE